MNRDEVPSSVRLTYDDFLNFPADGKRHEIIGGEHYVSPSPNTAHQRIVMRLTLAIGLYLQRNPVGELFSAPFDTVLSRFDVVERDLLFIAAENAHILTTENVRGAPDLVVEVLSPATRTRDEGVKRQLYERFGVREYWTIDPERETVLVDRQVGDAFVRVATLRAQQGGAVSTPCLPGFSAALSDLFAPAPRS